MLRLLTSFSVLLLCGFAIFRGSNVVRLVEMAAEPSFDRAAPPRIPALESLALELSLEADGHPKSLDAARKRRRELEELLSLKPLSPQAWLELAGLRFVTAEPFSRVLAALEMSWITGPNEGSLMMERALFALLEWRALPRDARALALEDLAGAIAGGATTPAQIAVAKRLLSQKPAALKGKIARMLRMDGLSTAELRAISL